MKNIIVLLSFLLCSMFVYHNTSAQSCANYSVSRTTGITYGSIYSTGNAIPSWRNVSNPGSSGGAYDDSRSYPVNIGFDFWYLGIRYTQFSVSTNGFIDFSSSTSNGTGTNGYGYDNSTFSSNTKTTGLALAPFYEDMTTTAAVDPLGEDIKYLTSGSYPNRVLTVEWREMSRYGESSPSNLNFQIKLYESTGVIEYIYGSNTFGTATWTYTCGINGSTISSSPTAAQLKCQQTANTSTFSNTAKNNLSTVPTSNSMITFTPVSPTGNPSALSFTSITKVAITLNWTDNASNEVGYVIYNSTDDINFIYATQTAANATSVTISSLLPGTTYYWKVYAVTEGKLSTALTGSNATLPAGIITSNASGLWNTGATWVGGVVPASGDDVTIANGHTVTLDANGTCNSLTIGQGASGQLTLGNNTTARSLTVYYNITVSAGANLITGASTATHTLSVGGNITNSGTLDLAPTSSRICNVTFNKNGDQIISGSGSTTNFNLITLNMGSSYDNVLDITSTNFTAPNNFLTITNGTFKLSSASTLTPFTSNETIGNSAAFWVNHAGATVTTTGGNITLAGYIKVSAGTITIGNSSNNCLTSSGGGNLIITGGNVNIAGRYDRVDATTTNCLNISGGTLTLNKIGSTTAGLSPFMMDVTGSTFNMSGGTIVIERSGASNLGYTNTGGTVGSITGGIIQIGNSSTPASQTIQINSSVSIPGLVIGNGVAVTGQLNTNSTIINSDLTISSGSTFDLTTLSANRSTAGGTLTIAGTLLLGGTTGGQTGSNFPTNFSTLTLTGGVVNFNKTTGGQTIYASPSYNYLTMGNTSGTQTAGGALLVYGLTTTSGGTLNMVSYALSATAINNSGTIQTQNSSSAPIPSGLTLGGTITFNAPASTQTIVEGTYNNITLSNLNSVLDTSISVLGTLTVNSGATLDLSTYTVSGAGAFTLSSGGGIKIGSLSGITSSGATGNIQCTTRSYSTGANYTYNGTSSQIFGNGLPSTVKDLNVDNGSSSIRLNGALSVTGTLTVYSGSTLDLATYTVSGAGSFILNSGGGIKIGSTAGITSSGATGNIQCTTRSFSTAGNYTYNGASTQVLGNGLPSTVNNLTLDNGNTTTLNLTSSKTINGILTIDTGVVFNINSGGTLTINNGNPSGDDMIVNGTLVSNSGTISYGTGATGIVQSGGRYKHAVNSGTIISATWSTGSTCEVTGVTTTLPAGVGQSFYDFTWNCASQSAAVCLCGGFATTINNNFTVQNTNSQELRLANGSSNTTTINGDLSVSTGGILNLTSAGGSPYIILKGNLYVSGTLTKTSAGAGIPTIAFTNSSTKTFTKTGTISNQINFVDSVGTIDFASNILTGSGSFTQLSGAGIIISNVAGITNSGATGNIQVIGTRTFNSGANFTYNGSVSQVFGNGLPSSVNNLTINNGNTALALNSSLTVNGTLTITSGKLSIGANTLTLNGDLACTSTNSLKANGSSNLSIGGNGTISTIYLDQTTTGTTNKLINLTINRTGQTITLGNEVQVSGAVIPTAGTLASGGYLTLLSDASGTARISAIGASADVTGNVTVQRYLPPITRRYRMLSSPVQNFAWSQLIDDMFVTGTGGATNGFDATPTNSTTCYTYQESTSGGRGWKAAGNISNTVSAATGMLVFVRGDRTLPSPNWYTGPGFCSQNNVTIDYLSQPINKGTYTPTLTYTNTGVAANDGWNFVGNPYPSQIDWSLLTKSNLTSFFYILDPATGSYVANNSGIIASGQGFLVQANAASPSITFTESAKSSSTAAYYFKSAATRIQVKMLKDSVNSDLAILDFNSSSSKGFNANEDAVKMSNSVVNIGFYIDSTITTQFNSVPVTATADTFILSTTYSTAGNYSLSFSDINNALPSSKNVYLRDLFNNNIINLRITSNYSFTISTNPATTGNRFQLIINDPSALPVQLLSFTANKSANTNDVIVKWQTANEKNNSHFIVERSLSNAENFAEISVVKGKENTNSLTDYVFVDENIVKSNPSSIYYRLKQVDKDGSYSYSNIALVSTDKSVYGFVLYPNPASEILQVKGLNSSNASYIITDMTGRVVAQETVPAGITESTIIDIAKLENGAYFIHFYGANNVSNYASRFLKFD